jgi:hypothetical protein
MAAVCMTLTVFSFVAYAEQRELDRLARVAALRQRPDMFMRKGAENTTSNEAKWKSAVRKAAGDTLVLGECVAADSLPPDLSDEEWPISRGGHAEGFNSPSGRFSRSKKPKRGKRRPTMSTVNAAIANQW